MFDADRPITKRHQDRLNRTLFAYYLAHCMLDYKDPESLVIGLNGGWGVGKTSVMNLVREELTLAANNLPDDEKPIILNFSVWSYSGQNQLIYNFFRRLSSTLRSAPYLKNANRIIYLLELYVSFFTHQPIPKSLRTKRSFLDKLRFGENDEVYAWESGRDLTSVKAELNELLRQQKSKIIIIIDNISRLYDYEIKQIFQIVKSMGDYANTAYLLALDKEHIIRVLNKIDGEGAESYLEKIVQLPFTIPAILQQDLEKIFSDRMSEVIATVPEEAWQIEYWADIYYGALKFFFKNCRDITRYVNTLNFSYPRLRDVVNPVDFFALTAIEVFLPSVYFGIRDNKDLFTDLLDNVYILDEEQIENDKLRCDEILARSKRIPRHTLLVLLTQLFPRLRRIYQPKLISYHSNTMARKLRRICSPDLFDTYFRLSMQSTQIPIAEFNTIIKLASDPRGFDQALTRLNQDERITNFLDQLDGVELNKIPPEHVQTIVNALLDNGDLFPLGLSGILSLNTPMRIHRIIHGLLRHFKSSEERFLILQNAIANANKSIFIIVNELKEQAREHGEDFDTFVPLEFRDLTPGQLDILRKLTISRIEIWAQDGRLIDHPQLLQILYAWRDWGTENKVKFFVEQMVKTDRGLITFLQITLYKAIDEAMTQYEKKLGWETYLANIETFIAPNTLEEHAKELFEDEYFEKLREREQLALMIFLDLLKTHTTKIIPQTTA